MPCFIFLNLLLIYLSNFASTSTAFYGLVKINNVESNNTNATNPTQLPTDWKASPYTDDKSIALSNPTTAKTARRIPIIPSPDRKSTRLNSSHIEESRMPSSA